MGSSIFPWRQAGVRFEDTVKMIGAHADGFRETIQVWNFLGLFNEAAGLGDGSGLPFGEAFPLRPAPLASPESPRLSFLAGGVEPNVFTLRQPRRASRSTVDAGRSHRVHELAIRSWIADRDGLPSALIIVEGLIHGCNDVV